MGYQGSDPQWMCHVCSRTITSERAMLMHLTHPLHNSKLLIPKHPKLQFTKFAEEKGQKTNVEVVTDVVPGEPVPPGMEDVVEGVCQIQAAFDAYTVGPLIGLEYIVELISTEEESEPRYICLLCEKKGDPRSVMVHVTSQNHYLKYISCFFRTAGNALNMIPRNLETRKGISVAITKVALEIEKHYGRLKPTSAEMETFMAKKYEILRQIDEKQHFRETPTTTFADLVTLEKIREYNNLPDEDNRNNIYQVSKKEENSREQAADRGDSRKDDLQKKFSFKIGKPEKSLGQDKIIPRREDGEGKMRDEKDGDNIIIISDDKNDKPIEVKSLSSISSATNSRSRSRSRSKSRSKNGSRYRGRSRSRSRNRRRRRSRSRSRSRFGKRGRRSRSKDRYRRRSPYLRRLSPYSRSRRSISRSRSRERRLKDSREPPPFRNYRTYTTYRPDSKSYDDHFYENEDMAHDNDRWKHSPRMDRSRESSIGHDDERKHEMRDNSRTRRDNSSFRSDAIALRRYEDDFNRSMEEEREREKKIKWAKFQEELEKLEEEMDEKFKYFKTRPEKHPMYPEEWKGFWNRRYKELQLCGKDPGKHDYKPEWIIFWDKRMKELHEQEVAEKKEELRRKLDVEEWSRIKSYSTDLQDVSPPTPEGSKDVTIDDIKNTWKALTGSDIKAPTKRSLSPWEGSVSPPPKDNSPPNQNYPNRQIQKDNGRKFYEIVPPIVHCLRMLSVLENQLGSLGPKILDLLSKALTLEKSKPSASMTLLQNREIYILFETVKEKMRGQLLAGIVKRNLVPATRAVIKSIDNMLTSNPLNKEVFEPVKVPGVGMVDKVAVAQQIASALIAQGKTDVSQQELEELINAVVGMAQASNTNPTCDMSSATFFSQLDIQKSTGSSHINRIISNMISTAQKTLGYTTQPQPLQHSSNIMPSVPQAANVYSQLASAGILPNINSSNLSVPQIAVPVSLPGQGIVQQYRTVDGMLNSVIPPTNSVSDTELKERLMKFRDLPREEQHSLIALLKELESSQPERVEKLREFVTASLTQPKCDIKPQVSHSGRLSPFSMRSGGANPSPERESDTLMEKNKKVIESDEDDDDYSFEDVYKAASEKLRIKQLEEEEEQKKQSLSIQQDANNHAISNSYPSTYDSPDVSSRVQLDLSNQVEESATNLLPEAFNKYQITYPNYNTQYEGTSYQSDLSAQQQPPSLQTPQHYHEMPSYSTLPDNFLPPTNNFPQQTYDNDPNYNRQFRMSNFNPYQKTYSRY